MAGLFGILATGSAWASWLIGLVVIIRMFRKEGALKGILAIICALYPFIWGWMKRDEENLYNVMYIWTGLIILAIILNVVAVAISR